MTLRDWLLISIIGIGWGSSFMFNAILLQDMGPLSISAGRIFFGALACWTYVIATGRMTPISALMFGNLLVLGVVMYAAPFSLYPLAQADLASGLTGIINAMTPIMVVIVSHLWPGGERATVLKSLGVLCGFAGIVLLAWPALGEGSELWAIVTAWTATLCYAVALNWSRRLRSLHSSVQAAMGLSLAFAVLVPFVMRFEGLPHVVGLNHWAALIFMGSVLTGVSFLIMWSMIPRIGATNASTVTFIAPVSAVILGALVLGEQILPAHLLGGVTIFLGLLLVDGRLFRRRKLN